MVRLDNVTDNSYPQQILQLVEWGPALLMTTMIFHQCLRSDGVPCPLIKRRGASASCRVSDGDFLHPRCNIAGRLPASR